MNSQKRLIKAHLMQSLEIHSVVEKMETKVQRINEHLTEKREKTMNLVLILITILSVFSLIYDLSKWFIDLGCPYEKMYPFRSIGIGVTVFLLIFIILKIHNRK